MILADTSVWIDHLHRGDDRLGAALERGEVLSHPLVIGELACGSLRNRAAVLALLGNLPAATSASDAEALALIERRALMGRGLGFIDVHLLASAALDGATHLWTRDRRLAAAAELGFAYDEPR